MSKSIKELFSKDNKRLKTDLAMIFVLGIFLVLVGGSFLEENSKNSNNVKNAAAAPIEAEAAEKSYDTIAETEKRLAEIFSKVEGAGEVVVMISPSVSNEMVLAEEVKTQKGKTDEKTVSGDGRTIDSDNYENKVVMVENSDGSTSPVILKEYAPKVEGILIVAQGGGDVVVKDALSRAAQALLNVPAHKVEILKMK